MNKYFAKKGVKYDTLTLTDALNDFSDHLKKLGTSKSELFEAMFNAKSDFLHQIAKYGKDINSD
jgi:hypothetical protein